MVVLVLSPARTVLALVEKESLMHRKLVSSLLIIHLLFIMLVISYNSIFNLTSKGMLVVGILALYMATLFIYLKSKALYPLVMLGTLIYLILNTAAFMFFVLNSFSSLTRNELLIFSFAFIPGIYSSLVYSIFLNRDRKK